MTGTRRPPGWLAMRYVAWRITPLTTVTDVCLAGMPLGQLSQAYAEVALQVALTTPRDLQRAAIEVL